MKYKLEDRIRLIIEERQGHPIGTCGKVIARVSGRGKHQNHVLLHIELDTGELTTAWEDRVELDTTYHTPLRIALRETDVQS